MRNLSIEDSRIYSCVKFASIGIISGENYGTIINCNVSNAAIETVNSNCGLILGNNYSGSIKLSFSHG